jgi:hypothetical protein
MKSDVIEDKIDLFHLFGQIKRHHNKDIATILEKLGLDKIYTLNNSDSQISRPASSTPGCWNKTFNNIKISSCKVPGYLSNFIT